MSRIHQLRPKTPTNSTPTTNSCQQNVCRMYLLLSPEPDIHGPVGRKDCLPCMPKSQKIVQKVWAGAERDLGLLFCLFDFFLILSTGVCGWGEGQHFGQKDSGRLD
ncbi:hypothetical protein N431DRAFT_43167 [Stipitochalara longipes BDJ]|nr:hypothetical protein N431DRAFT_43167 [Stipitochalara longipes BDJ]